MCAEAFGMGGTGAKDVERYPNNRCTGSAGSGSEAYVAGSDALRVLHDNSPTDGISRLKFIRSDTDQD